MKNSNPSETLIFFVIFPAFPLNPELFSSNQNQRIENTTIYVDLTNPQVTSFVCIPNPVNDSQIVNCSASITDSVNLNYAIIGHNATGAWQNSSSLTLGGLNGEVSYIISSGNTTMPGSSLSERFSTFKQAQQARYRLAPLALYRFTEGVPIREDSQPLSQEEVEERCFAVLGYMEEYFRPPSQAGTEIKVNDEMSLNLFSLFKQLTNSSYSSNQVNHIFNRWELNERFL